MTGPSPNHRAPAEISPSAAANLLHPAEAERFYTEGSQAWPPEQSDDALTVDVPGENRPVAAAELPSVLRGREYRAGEMPETLALMLSPEERDRRVIAPIFARGRGPRHRDLETAISLVPVCGRTADSDLGNPEPPAYGAGAGEAGRWPAMKSESALCVEISVVTASINEGTPTVLVSSSGSPANYTMSIPTGTDLSTIVVEATATAGTGGVVAAQADVYGIFIQ